MVKRLARVLGLLAVLGLGAGAAGAVPVASASVAAPAVAAGSGAAVIRVNPVNLTKPYAATVSKAPLAGAYKICTNSGTLRCMTGQGNGFQFQMQQSGYSTFSAVVGPDGSLFETPNSLCPQAKDAANGWVVIGNSVCTSTNKSDEWVVSNRLKNASYGRYLAVLFNNQDGAKTTTQPGTGAYYLGLYLN